MEALDHEMIHKYQDVLLTDPELVERGGLKTDRANLAFDIENETLATKNPDYYKASLLERDAINSENETEHLLEEIHRVLVQKKIPEDKRGYVAIGKPNFAGVENKLFLKGNIDLNHAKANLDLVLENPSKLGKDLNSTQKKELKDIREAYRDLQRLEVPPKQKEVILENLGDKLKELTDGNGRFASKLESLKKDGIVKDKSSPLRKGKNLEGIDSLDDDGPTTTVIRTTPKNQSLIEEAGRVKTTDKWKQFKKAIEVREAQKLSENPELVNGIKDILNEVTPRDEQTQYKEDHYLRELGKLKQKVFNEVAKTNAPIIPVNIRRTTGGELRGHYLPNDNLIQLSSHRTLDQKISTLDHELTHRFQYVLSHDKDLAKRGGLKRDQENFLEDMKHNGFAKKNKDYYKARIIEKDARHSEGETKRSLEEVHKKLIQGETSKDKRGYVAISNPTSIPVNNRKFLKGDLDLNNIERNLGVILENNKELERGLNFREKRKLRAIREAYSDLQKSELEVSNNLKEVILENLGKKLKEITDTNKTFASKLAPLEKTRQAKRQLERERALEPKGRALPPLPINLTAGEPLPLFSPVFDNPVFHTNQSENKDTRGPKKLLERTKAPEVKGKNLLRLPDSLIGKDPLEVLSVDKKLKDLTFVEGRSPSREDDTLEHMDSLGDDGSRPVVQTTPESEELIKKTETTNTWKRFKKAIEVRHIQELSKNPELVSGIRDALNGVTQVSKDKEGNYIEELARIKQDAFNKVSKTNTTAVPIFINETLRNKTIEGSYVPSLQIIKIAGYRPLAEKLETLDHEVTHRFQDNLSQDKELAQRGRLEEDRENFVEDIAKNKLATENKSYYDARLVEKDATHSEGETKRGIDEIHKKLIQDEIPEDKRGYIAISKPTFNPTGHKEFLKGDLDLNHIKENLDLVLKNNKGLESNLNSTEKKKLNGIRKAYKDLGKFELSKNSKEIILENLGEKLKGLANGNKEFASKLLPLEKSQPRLYKHQAGKLASKLALLKRNREAKSRLEEDSVSKIERDPLPVTPKVSIEEGSEDLTLKAKGSFFNRLSNVFRKKPVINSNKIKESSLKFVQGKTSPSIERVALRERNESQSDYSHDDIVSENPETTIEEREQIRKALAEETTSKWKNLKKATEVRYGQKLAENPELLIGIKDTINRVYSSDPDRRRVEKLISREAEDEYLEELADMKQEAFNEAAKIDVPSAEIITDPDFEKKEVRGRYSPLEDAIKIDRNRPLDKKLETLDHEIAHKFQHILLKNEELVERGGLGEDQEIFAEDDKYNKLSKENIDYYRARIKERDARSSEEETKRAIDEVYDKLTEEGTTSNERGYVLIGKPIPQTVDNNIFLRGELDLDHVKKHLDLLLKNNKELQKGLNSVGKKKLKAIKEAYSDFNRLEVPTNLKEILLENLGEKLRNLMDTNDTFASKLLLLDKKD